MSVTDRRHLLTNVAAILRRAWPRERVILNAVEETAEREDVMVLTKEDWLSLQVAVAALEDDNYEFTDAALRYAARYYPKTRCTQCDKEIRGVYVVPTTHSSGKDGCYAVTLTFSCPEHKADIGRAFANRLVVDVANGVPFRDLAP